ncbi:endonuclease [Mesoaciditoga sp.]
MQKMTSSEIQYIFETLFDAYGPQGWWPAYTPFEVAVGAILVQNTMWRNVKISIKNLEKIGLLEPYRMYVTSNEKLAAAIKPSGFPRLKAERLRNFLHFFSEFSFDFEQMNKYDTETLRKLLLKVNGIGKETADSLLLYIFNRPVFILDAYTKRFFSRLFSQEAMKMFEKEKVVNALKDAKEMGEFHALIVQHSKAHCRSKPMCSGCPLRKVCEFGSEFHE